MYLKFLRPHQLQEATARDLPLLIPAGCVETHGPHLAIGHDTLIVEEICARIAGRLQVVIAPPFDFAMRLAARQMVLSTQTMNHLARIPNQSCVIF